MTREEALQRIAPKDRAAFLKAWLLREAIEEGAWNLLREAVPRDADPRDVFKMRRAAEQILRACGKVGALTEAVIDAGGVATGDQMLQLSELVRLLEHFLSRFYPHALIAAASDRPEQPAVGSAMRPAGFRPQSRHPDPHNTGYGMQLRFNLGGMKGLPRGGRLSHLARDLGGAHGHA